MVHDGIVHIKDYHVFDAEFLKLAAAVAKKRAAKASGSNDATLGHHRRRSNSQLKAQRQIRQWLRSNKCKALMSVQLADAVVRREEDRQHGLAYGWPPKFKRFGIDSARAKDFARRYSKRIDFEGAKFPSVATYWMVLRFAADSGLAVMAFATRA